MEDNIEKIGESKDDKEEHPATDEKQPSSQLYSAKQTFTSLGPGIITGESDDNPSGIATFSQAGAQFGFGLLWMALFQYPMMIVIQEICARIGLVTGKGLSSIIRERYSRKAIFPLAGLLLIANTINIGADIAPMGASVRLLLPQLPVFITTLSFALFIVASEIIIPYKKYIKILKYIALTLFAYVITAIIVGGNWSQILISSLIPHIELKPEFAMMFVAIIGTSISPYLFFWQASEEAEEDVARQKIKDIGKGNPKITKKEIKLMRIDIAAGIAFAEIIVWTIMITSAGSLYAHGVTDIKSADQAAKALEPLVKTFPNAGEISKTIFAFGIIGTGLLAVPVLASFVRICISRYIWLERRSEQKVQTSKGVLYCDSCIHNNRIVNELCKY